jgi:hypothetical protein
MSSLYQHTPRSRSVAPPVQKADDVPWLWAAILAGAAFLGGGAHNSRNNGRLQQVNGRRKPTRARTSFAYTLTLSASIGARGIGGTVAREVAGAAAGGGSPGQEVAVGDTVRTSQPHDA